MSAAPYIFPAQQAEFLRALRDGRYRPPARTRNVPTATSLVSRMPPVHEQALRGTCVSSAATAMLEYYEDCKMRLSVQYLFAATKEVERAALERNLSRLRLGEPLDSEFEYFHHSKLLQLRMMADANGGINTPVMRPYLTQFEETVRTRYESMEGSLLRSCFNVLEFRGTCRYSLWPYAGVSAAPLFGPGERVKYPPGSDDDAKKHRVLSGLYLLPAPNNVDEIRGILAGVNDRRPMPVCVTVSFFAGCDGETFSFPHTEETPDGLAAKDDWLGVHGMLIVGYADNAASPGGGYFLVRNSLGEAWGNRGYGKLPYAYVACFALEAGTILQDLVDYTGDGYGGLNTDGSYGPRPRRRKWFTFLNLLVAAVLVAGTWATVKWYQEQKAPVPSSSADPSAPSVPPYAEVTVYGRDTTVSVTLPPPWNDVKGEAIDGGMVFRLPVKTREEEDAIRKKLDAEPTLREKRGKPLTYDLVTFYDLVGDPVDVKRTIGEFAAERFPVRIESESNGVLRVSTISPRGLRERLKQMYDLEAEGSGRWVLNSKAVVPPPGRPPYVEVTVYGRDATVSVTLPPPWNDVKGEVIDGGMVFRLPAKTREEEDAIRKQLDAEPTLREKRGKPLTYDLVTFYELVSSDLPDVKKTIGMLAAEQFLVRIEGEDKGVLRVSTLSPRGFKARLQQVYDLEIDNNGRWVLTPKTGGTRSRASENQVNPVVTNAAPETKTMVKPTENAAPSPVYSVMDEPSPIVAVTDVPPPAVVDVPKVHPPVAVAVTNEPSPVAVTNASPPVAVTNEPSPVTAGMTNALPTGGEGRPIILRVGRMSSGGGDF